MTIPSLSHSESALAADGRAGAHRPGDHRPGAHQPDDRLGSAGASPGGACPGARAAVCDALSGDALSGDAPGEGMLGHAFCPRFHHAVELIGRRWTGVVLRAMLRGATRFSDIRAAVPALSDKMLVERLKELETEGVVTRTVVPSTPVRVEYHLTEKGRGLDAVLEALAGWVARWVPGSGGPAA